MINRLCWQRIALVLLIASSLLSCASTESTPTASISDNLIDIQHAGLLLNDQGQFELGISLRNNSQQRLWVTVYFQTPQRLSDCFLSSELEPQQSHAFNCPQAQVLPDINYPINIKIYNDLAQSIALDTIVTGLRFSADESEPLQ